MKRTNHTQANNSNTIPTTTLSTDPNEVSMSSLLDNQLPAHIIASGIEMRTNLSAVET